MAARTLAGTLGLKGDWDLGEDGWKDLNDLNLVILSVVTQGRAKSLVSATPGAPTEGDVHLFSDTHPTQAGKIGVYDEATWNYITPQEGWRMFDIASDFHREFNGSTWVEVTSGGGGGSGGYYVPFGFTTTPTASEKLLIHVFGVDVDFLDDFAGSEEYVGANPAATFTMTVAIVGVGNVGTISVSTGGAVTFATTGGALSVTKGQVMTITAPVTPDTTIVNSAFTLVGVES